MTNRIKITEAYKGVRGVEHIVNVDLAPIQQAVANGERNSVYGNQIFGQTPGDHSIYVRIDNEPEIVIYGEFDIDETDLGFRLVRKAGQ